MFNVGSKIEFRFDYNSDEAAKVGYIISRRDRNTGRCTLKIWCAEEEDTYSLDLSTTIDSAGNTETNNSGVVLRKIDDGEEFFSSYLKIGTRVISHNSLGRYDGQPLRIVEFAYSSSIHGIYYCVRFESGNISGEIYYVLPGNAEEKFVYTGGELMCPNCGRREYVLPYHRYNPPIQFFSVCNKNAQKYFGVELEVELGGESHEEARKIVQHMRRKNGDLFAYVSHDSSLCNGLEIITQPATIGYHRSLEEEYKNLFKMLVEDGYRGHECQNAGIHVHVSRAYFGESEELYSLEEIMKNPRDTCAK